MEHVDWLGYAASILIATSLTMSNIWRLRLINLFGSGTMAIYGALIGSAPVALLNGFIFSTNVFHLRRMARRRDYFRLLEVINPTNVFLRAFLEHYRDDIGRHFPHLDVAEIAACRTFFVVRNLVPVGLFVERPAGDNDVEIVLDYVVPSHRDLKNAHFVFSEKAEELGAQGFRRFLARGSTPAHRRYLERIGFRPVAGDGPDLYQRPIPTPSSSPHGAAPAPR